MRKHVTQARGQQFQALEPATQQAHDNVHRERVAG